MHLHTQRQLELARRAARRRMTDSSNEQTNPIPMLMPESSVDSTQTQGSRWIPPSSFGVSPPFTNADDFDIFYCNVSLSEPQPMSGGLFAWLEIGMGG